MTAATRPIIPPLSKIIPLLSSIFNRVNTAILLKDLTFMEENTDRTTDNLINFEKVYLIGQVLVDMHECGIAKYDLEVVSIIFPFECTRKFRLMFFVDTPYQRIPYEFALFNGSSTRRLFAKRGAYGF